MRQETSARLHCVLAICDQGLGSCAVGAARVLEGPVRHGPLERLHSTAEFRLRGAKISGCVIGRFVQPSEGVRLLGGSAPRELPRFEADEITRLP